MVKRNKKRGIQLFPGIERISLIGPSNGLISGRPTREGFGTVVRAAKTTARFGGLFLRPVTSAAKKRARGFVTRKRKQIFEKKPTSTELLARERKAILKKLRAKAKVRKEEKEIMRLELAPLREIVPKSKKKKILKGGITIG